MTSTHAAVPSAAQPQASFHAADHLVARVAKVDAATCVGLDPVLDRLPASLRPADPSNDAACASAIEAFSVGVIDSVHESCAAVKIQAACYERYGAAGFAAMGRVLAHARASGLSVVYDAKRGDIGISAEHYANGARALGAHWTTINAYLGSDGIAPFLTGGQGAFALVRTSNPSGDALQTLPLADGRTIAEAVADLVSKLGEASVGASGFSALGAVVGATKRAEIASLRARMPRTIFLVPGYGAQGGTADDVRAAFTRGNQGALITASRSVIYPSFAGSGAAGSGDWRDAIRAAAVQFAGEIRAITGGAS
ncbi:MAG: orotidine-5'-phosphate decarboxylase [bacterium]|jgi:orotidine-5'-phosphate decarboxylase